MRKKYKFGIARESKLNDKNFIVELESFIESE